MIQEILLFGGVFDPPHNGHMLVIQQALKQINPDELWIVPSYGSTFGKQMSPWQDRVEMTRLLLQATGFGQQAKLSTIEIENQLSGSTYELYSYLTTNHEPRTTNYSFLIGSDQLQSFKKWVNWEELLKVMKFYVYIRKGFPVLELLPGMELLDGPEITDVSSTMIREQLRSHESIHTCVPASIEQYILEHHLYL